METTVTNFYETLGVPRTADAAAIKAVFRARTRAVHPDAPGGGDPVMMAALNEAYETLSEPGRRERHDAELDAEAAAAARRATAQPEPEPVPEPAYEPVAQPAGPAEVTARTVVGGWAMLLALLAVVVSLVVFFVARRNEQDGAGDLIAMIVLGLVWLSWWGRGGWKSPAIAGLVGAVWYGLQHGEASAAWWGSAGVMLAAFCLLAIAKIAARGGESR